MNHSTEVDQLAAALVAIQAEVPSIPKDATNPFFKSRYADLPAVMETAQPIVSKHGIAVSQDPDFDGENDLLTTMLVHVSGQWKTSTMRLHLPKADPQGQGSALTYARRYAYMAALGLVADEDDDGNAASKAKKRAASESTLPRGMIPAATAKRRLVDALDGDKERAARFWGDRGGAPISEDALAALIATREVSV